MAREYFAAYHSYLKAVEPLNDAERGRLFTACLNYSMTGAEPELRGNERFVWPSIREQIGRDKTAYAERCAANRENALQRHANASGGKQPSAKPAKEKEKEKAKATEKATEKDAGSDYDDDDALSPRAEDAELVRLWQRAFGRKPTPPQCDELAGWLAAWELDLVEEALGSAAEAGAQNPVAYIRATLQDWKARGIRTIRDWADAEARRDGMI
ncbi:MAG: DUF6291 domain-containing protein [Clostridiaceae bacterium]